LLGLALGLYEKSLTAATDAADAAPAHKNISVAQVQLAEVINGDRESTLEHVNETLELLTQAVKHRSVWLCV
jgi:hypothetical protein